MQQGSIQPIRFFMAAALIISLSGCGDSSPEHVSDGVGAKAGAAPVVASHQLAVGAFAEAVADPIAAASRASSDCNLDGINGSDNVGQDLSRQGDASLSGWMADSKTGSAPVSIDFVLKGERSFVLRGTTGEARPDVARVKQQPALASSGYLIKADLSAVLPGRYQLMIVAPVGGETVVCDTHKAITIR